MWWSMALQSVWVRREMWPLTSGPQDELLMPWLAQGRLSVGCMARMIITALPPTYRQAKRFREVEWLGHVIRQWEKEETGPQSFLPYIEMPLSGSFSRARQHQRGMRHESAQGPGRAGLHPCWLQNHWSAQLTGALRIWNPSRQCFYSLLFVLSYL